MKIANELKFRVWDKIGCKWIKENDLLISLDGELLINYGLLSETKYETYEVENKHRYIIQRYTGVKAEGVEIYEGDILEITQKNGFKFIGEVEFGHLWYHGQRHGFIGFAIRDKEVDACFPLFTYDLNDCYVDVKVIGNICEKKL